MTAINFIDAQTCLFQLGLHRTDFRIVEPIGKGGRAKNSLVRMTDADGLKAIRTMSAAPSLRNEQPKESEYLFKFPTSKRRAVSTGNSLESDINPTAVLNSSRKDAKHNGFSAQIETFRVVRTNPPEFRVGSKIVAASMPLGERVASRSNNCLMIGAGYRCRTRRSRCWPGFVNTEYRSRAASGRTFAQAPMQHEIGADSNRIAASTSADDCGAVCIRLEV